jgi:(E)-4-hydroxy-3-methylbut-2-enyl-diphosphate synthase
VVADLSKLANIKPTDLEAIGYTYNMTTDKWFIGDAAADYIFCNEVLNFELPGTLKVLLFQQQWSVASDKEKYLLLLDTYEYLDDMAPRSTSMNFVMIDCYNGGTVDRDIDKILAKLKTDKTAVICLSSSNSNSMQSIRRMYIELLKNEVKNPVIVICDSSHATTDESLIHYAVETGALLIDGFGDGICLGHHYGNNAIVPQTKLLNSIAFGILQATRTRISKTEYISCPSCGRTLFDLQETTAKIRAVTNHLKGVKIAIMGCIVNGPGEMADADFGYVGSGVGKITLYRGKEVVKRNVNSEVAVDELINLLKESDAWVE